MMRPGGWLQRKIWTTSQLTSQFNINNLEEGKMKKLVIFTVVMVLALAGATFAQTTVEANNNTIPIALGSGATAVAVPVDDSVNHNNVNTSTGSINNTKTNTDVNVAVDNALNNNTVNSPTTDVDVKLKNSLNDNTVNSGTINNQKTDVDVKDALNNNKVALGGTGTDSGQIAGRDTHPINTDSYNDNSNQNNPITEIIVVDNAILANVNVEQAAGDLVTPNQTITFNKTQHAEINNSFTNYNGVANVNSIAGNMNTANAYTTIAVTR